MIRGWLLVALLASPALLAKAPNPQDFAFGMPVLTREVASAYRVSLPLEVYRNSVSPDLGDVRVFNADGDAVSYAILRRTEPATAPADVTLPLFPLRGDARAALNGLKLTLNTAQANVQMSTLSPATPGGVEQYVLDGRPLQAATVLLTVVWPEHSADFSGRLRVEASDDFDQWKTVVRAAPIANLHAADQELIENRIDIPGVRSKFWRLTWLGAVPPFELNAVRATAESGAPRTQWSTEAVNGQADTGKGEFLFDLGAALPVERLNLTLPDTNSIYMTDLSSRARPQDTWVTVIRAGIYRLTTAEGEQSNSPVTVPTTRARYWRARVLGSGAQPSALRLEAGWSAPDIEFLAQGKGPYLLAFGSDHVNAAESNLNFLPESATVARATLGGRSTLGGASRLAERGADWKRSVLWTVLVAAVAILALMARRVARMSRSGEP